jgi:hypothetical protein
MARPSVLDTLTISDLEDLLRVRKGALPRLRKERKRLEKELAIVERQLSKLGGRGRRGRPPGSGGGKRPRNKKSLVEVIHDVLTKAGEAMRVGDIHDAVKAAGYKSSSDNFRGIVNQTLIKDKQFASAGRGLYKLK